jgi:YD repeat-containing protein
MIERSQPHHSLSPAGRLFRAVVITLVTTVVATMVTSIPLVPGIPRPSAAQATAGNPTRMCFNQEVSGSFVSASDTVSFKLFMPTNVTVALSGSADVVGPNQYGRMETGFYINFGNGPWTANPHADLSGTLGNTGPPTDYLVTVSQNANARVDWRFTMTVTNGITGPPGPCGPLSTQETTGTNCAERHATTGQLQLADPVNTATGNFHESFTDFAIAGGGPGLTLEHSYNSLQAAADGPLGFGWSHAYGVSLAVDQAAGTATVTQESGAQVPFFLNTAGTYDPPPRAVASLVKNTDGSYTFNRCNRTTMQFSAAKQLTAISDLNGYVTTLQYVAGRLDTVTDTSVTNTAKRKLKVNWTGAHITSVSDSSSPLRTLGFGFDAAGNLTDHTDAGGASWHFTYDTSHRLETIRRPRFAGMTNPPVTRNVYDGTTGRVKSQTDELLRTTSFDYATIPGATKVTDPKGNVTVIAYTNYQPTALTRGYGTAEAATWKFETNYLGAVTKTTDPNLHEVNSRYDERGNLIWTRDALNREMRATYNQFDQPDIVTDPSDVTTDYDYDPKGNLTKVSVSEGTPAVVIQSTSFSYDDAARPGDLTTITDPATKIWKRAYDGFGNVSDEIDPLLNRTRYGYDDATGWLTSAVSPRGTAATPVVAPGCTPPAMGCAKFVHDGWGHVSEATDANNHKAVRHFDADGNLDYQVDANNNRTDFFYTVADELERVHRADGSDLRTAYWPDGTVKETRDGANQPTAYDYDAQGRLKTVKDPKVRTTTYGYDLAGNLKTKADPGGTCPGTSCTTMSYDVADQLKSISYGDGTTPGVTNIDYDRLGRRTAMTDGSGTSTWTWDSLGRIKATKDGANHQLAYHYANPRDPADIISYVGVGDVTRVFDDVGRMRSVKDWLGNTTALDPDADSNLTTVTGPAGTGLVDSFKFDNADQLIGITAKKGATGLASFDYGANDGAPEGARDNAGQLTAVSSTGMTDTHSFGYDQLNRLKTVDAGTYTYDPADNLTGTPTPGCQDDLRHLLLPPIPTGRDGTT